LPFVTDNDWFAFLFITTTFTENCFERKSVHLIRKRSQASP